MMDLTPQEQYIIEIMREARPFEVIEITKDQLGRPNRYLVTRKQKIVVADGVVAIKV